MVFHFDRNFLTVISALKIILRIYGKINIGTFIAAFWRRIGVVPPFSSLNINNYLTQEDVPQQKAPTNQS
jgi:hypothetical protein